MKGEDRDIDRLLKRVMRDDTRTSSPCVEAETLAAWAEGSLPAEEAASVELHLSNCARCQAMLAVFARTEPTAAAPAAVPFWKRVSAAWIVPLAAAAALIVYVAVPSRRAAPTEQPAIARVETRPSVAPAPVAPQPSAAPAREAPVAVSKGQLESKPSAPEPRAVTAPTNPPASTSASPPPAAAQAELLARAAAAPPAPPSAASAPSATDLSRQEPVTVSGASPIVETARRDVGITTVAEIVATTPSTAAGRGGGAGSTAGAVSGGRGGNLAARDAVQDIGAVPARWRVLSNGRVERSTTGGASWQPIAIDPPAFVTGGVAPSSTVCWLVGRGGLVLLAVDGVRFDRVPIPATVDVASIQAFSARQATVTTTDGRTFATTDGGITWR